MLLNLLVAVLILFVTLYLANQGMLSALLALATSIFSSVLAMALMEPLQGIIGGWRPNYARSITFLLLFFLIFSFTRIIADICVPKTIKLSLLINRIAGGFVGFFAGLVVIGTILIGIELLPVSRTPLGFESLPGGGYMQAVDAEGKSLLGEVAKPRNVWLAPDRFVLAIWNGTSGRGLGGNRPFASVHPDLSIEAYGYRNHVDGSLRALPADLLTVKDAWMADTPLKNEGGTDVKADNGKRLVMVRTLIGKGDRDQHISADNGDPPYFYVAASQVRLVTSKSRQYYPIGYLEAGRRFIPLTLDTGYVVDDYVKGVTAVEDWIFQVPEDESPVSIEVKQLARADLTGILKDKLIQPMAAAEYPTHPYFKDLTTLTVTFDPKARELKNARVYVLSSANQRKDIPNGPITDAHSHLLKIDDYMKNNTSGWTEPGKPGVPNLSTVLQTERVGQTMLNDTNEAAINWGGLVPLLLLGQAQPDGPENLRFIPEYFETTFVPMLKNVKSGSLIVASGTADPSSGRVEIPKISPGHHTILITMEVATTGTPRAFFVWVKDLEFKASTPQSIKVADSADNAATFQLDLDAKMP